MTSESVAREWEVWAAENLLRGVARASIEASLVARGVSTELARETLDALERSPFLEASQPIVRDARRFAMIAKMRERLERDASHPTEIERRDAPSAEEFFDTYYAGGRPVILRGLVDRWPACTRWTFPALRERFGDAEVKVTVGRDADPLYGATFAHQIESWRFRDLVTRIESGVATNDFYLVAQNRALQGSLASMIDDIAMPSEWMLPDKLASDASIWIGPAGTRTRMHHDFKPLLTCHVRGRKRWRLIPPTERTLLDRLRMSHTTLDPEHDAMDGILVKEAVLEEGEAIFIPAGWWHHVVALDPAITVSLAAWPKDEVEMFWLRLGSG